MGPAEELVTREEKFRQEYCLYRSHSESRLQFFSVLISQTLISLSVTGRVAEVSNPAMKDINLKSYQAMGEKRRAL